MSTIALGIDLSTVALHCAHGDQACPERTILPLAGDRAEERTLAVTEQLGELLGAIEARHAPRWGVLVVERPFLRLNPRTAIALSQVQGAVMAVAHTWRWTVIEEDPSAIREAVIGTARAPDRDTKGMVRRWVERELGLRLGSDAADSVVIYRYALGLLAALDTQEQPCTSEPS